MTHVALPKSLNWILALSCTLVAACSKSTEAPGPSGGCQDDTECSADRVCEDGKCVQPGGSSGSGAAPGSGGTGGASASGGTGGASASGGTGAGVGGSGSCQGASDPSGPKFLS